MCHQALAGGWWLVGRTTTCWEILSVISFQILNLKGRENRDRNIFTFVKISNYKYHYRGLPCMRKLRVISIQFYYNQ